MIDLQQKTIKINGKKIAYYDEGSSESNVVICLHGWGENKDTFSKLIRKLDPYFRVICLDLPGHGDSEPVQGQDFGNYVSIIKKFVDERWKGKISIVGFSIGGVLSLMFALKYPDKVDKLVIWESGADFKGLKRYRMLRPWLTLINSSRNLSQVVCYLGTCKVGHKLISTVFSGEIADSMRIADGHTLVSLACEAVHRDF
ncbi:MAG: alpha/beta hydrolase, partial [Patescibacteria group bacterium]|nr:alpha/beta hydrolase [Patescibacteria group bacterium]